MVLDGLLKDPHMSTAPFAGSFRAAPRGRRLAAKTVRGQPTRVRHRVRSVGQLWALSGSCWRV
eukprot:12736202-Alexandrium_andersonii.AAC.1